MYVRNYQLGEEHEIWRLFYNTVHAVNTADYTSKQLKAWAPCCVDIGFWQQKLKKLSSLVCVQDDIITGYSDLQENGYIDHFFCHQEYQRCGVGSALMTHIQQRAKSKKMKSLTADVSITARPFFEHKGFTTLKQQQVQIRGQILTNYKMEKILMD